VIIIQQPAPPPAPAPVPEPPRPPERRSNLGGIGAGAFLLSADASIQVNGSSPAIVVQARRISLVSEQFGFELLSSVVFHDWETMGDIYHWYFTDTDDDPDRSNVGTKILLLWPGLILAPFAGANYGMGFGGIFYVSPKAPSLFIDAGGELSLLLQPSSEFNVDVGLGFYAGLGLEFSERIGMSVRTVYQAPVFHENQDIRAVTMYVSIDFMRD
jgi:hypothetical protein